VAFDLLALESAITPKPLKISKKKAKDVERVTNLDGKGGATGR
jgi:hypothetical protein